MDADVRPRPADLRVVAAAAGRAARVVRVDVRPGIVFALVCVGECVVDKVGVCLRLDWNRASAMRAGVGT